MRVHTFVLVTLSLLVAACGESEPVAPEGLEVGGTLQAAKGGKPGKEKPGDNGGSYTITKLGEAFAEGFVKDINDAGVIVGGASDRAARWTVAGGGYSMELLEDGGGVGSWAEAVNAIGDVVGVIWGDPDFTNRAALWSDGTAVQILNLLDPYTHQHSQAYDINDDGQISGQSYTGSYDAARAVRWEPDGSVTDLGVLPGYEKSIGWAINNLGWVGGSSRPADYSYPAKRQHAVLWIVESDGQISAPLDLHPVPEIQSIVKGISDESTDGKVYLAGTLDYRPVVWVVDVAPPHEVIEHVLPGEGSGGAEAVNAAGEVLVSPVSVWTLATGQVASLPTLSGRCSSAGRGINSDGAVVGSSGVFQKGRCTRHAVLWTKKN